MFYFEKQRRKWSRFCCCLDKSSVIAYSLFVYICHLSAFTPVYSSEASYQWELLWYSRNLVQTGLWVYVQTLSTSVRIAFRETSRCVCVCMFTFGLTVGTVFIIFFPQHFGQNGLMLLVLFLSFFSLRPRRHLDTLYPQSVSRVSESKRWLTMTNPRNRPESVLLSVAVRREHPRGANVCIPLASNLLTEC